MDRIYTVALYARVSTSAQADRDLSVPEQLERLRDFCRNRGYRVVREFTDEGISGGKQAARKGFQAMLREGLKRPAAFDVVLTRDLARFGRGDEDAPNRAKLRANGVRVATLDNTEDLDRAEGISAAGRFAERTLGAAGIYQREGVPELVIASQRRAVREGRNPGSTGTVFGYRSVYIGDGPKPKRTTEIDPVKGPLVRGMFERIAGGDSLRNVTAWLNANGVKAPRGETWYPATVRRILQNETVTGDIIYGRLKTVIDPDTEEVRYIPSGVEPVRFEGGYPPLVDRELFNTVQAILADPDRKKFVKKGVGNPNNLLQGIGRCAQCGWSLGPLQRNGVWYLACNHKRLLASEAHENCAGTIPTTYVDAVVFRFLDRLLSYPGFANTLREAVEAYNRAAKEFRGVSEIELLDARIKSLTKSVTNLVSQVEKTGSPALTERLLIVEADLAQANEQRAALEAALGQVETLDAERIVSVATALKKARLRNDREAIKSLLAELVDRIEVDYTKRKNRAITFSYRQDIAMPDIPQSEGEAPKFDIPSFAVRVHPDGSEERLEMPAPSGAVSPGVDFTTEAPLRFVMKWDLSNVERIGKRALERIGAISA